jgi:DNA-binding NtrC family response regulator
MLFEKIKSEILRRFYMVPLDSPRILVVDDDREFRRSLIKIFQKAGYQVNVASDSKQAFAALDRRHYDLIVLDLKMPGKSGLEVLREIATRRPESKVIVVTAFGDATSYREAMAIGAFEYLDKPVKRQAILEASRRALANCENSVDSLG